jgi:hypothetical protein
VSAFLDLCPDGYAVHQKSKRLAMVDQQIADEFERHIKRFDRTYNNRLHSKIIIAFTNTFKYESMLANTTDRCTSVLDV